MCKNRRLYYSHSFVHPLLLHPTPSVIIPPSIISFPLLYPSLLAVHTTCGLLSDSRLSEMPHVEGKVVLSAQAWLSVQSFHHHARWLTSCDKTPACVTAELQSMIMAAIQPVGFCPSLPFILLISWHCSNLCIFCSNDILYQVDPYTDLICSLHYDHEYNVSMHQHLIPPH